MRGEDERRGAALTGMDDWLELRPLGAALMATGSCSPKMPPAIELWFERFHQLAYSVRPWPG